MELCGIGESLFLFPDGVRSVRRAFFSDEQHLEGVLFPRPLRTGVLVVVVVVVDRVVLSCWGSLEEGHH